MSKKKADITWERVWIVSECAQGDWTVLEVYASLSAAVAFVENLTSGEPYSDLFRIEQFVIMGKDCERPEATAKVGAKKPVEACAEARNP